jgi:hypothetical protein
VHNGDMRVHENKDTKVRTFEEKSYNASAHSPLCSCCSSCSSTGIGTGGVARAGWEVFDVPEVVLLTLCGGGANPPFSLGNALGNTVTPALAWGGFLNSDETAAPVEEVSMFPTVRPVTSPAGAVPVDAGPETFSREEVLDVRRCAGGGVALSAAILDATDTVFSSSAPASSSCACKGDCQIVVRSPLYGKMIGVIEWLE